MELCCLSPNQQSLHSLDLNKGSIITQFLPLQQEEGQEQMNNNSNNQLQVIGEEMTSSSQKSSTFYDYKDEEPSLALVTASSNDNIHTSNNTSNYKKPTKITTPLPSYILQSLSIDAPLELLCIDNDDPHSSMASPTKSLPLLCLYSAKAAYNI